MPPLGPLNGKSFATTISPWIVTLDALAPFKTSNTARESSNIDVPTPCYLQDPDPKSSFDIALNAFVQPTSAPEASVICSSNSSFLYWTLRDLVAHQTVNGCSLRTGDLLATGTISGPTPDSHGCLVELAHKGGVKVMNKSGNIEQRKFFEDGDTVSLIAKAGNGVGFGDCTGTIIS